MTVTKSTSMLVLDKNRQPAATSVDLSRRCRLPELMDAPDLDPASHYAALRGLQRINALSRSAAALWPSLRRLAVEQPGQPLRVLDVACGGGDTVVALAKRAAANRLHLEIDGCDISPRAIAYAQDHANRHHVAGSKFFITNVVHDAIPGGYDVLMCSLFLHHLEEDHVRQLLRQMANACRRGVLVSDLRRTRLGYALAVLGCHVLTRSRIVQTDGPLSVRAGWSEPELLRLVAEAGMSNARLTRHWPQRCLLTWRKP